MKNKSGYFLSLTVLIIVFIMSEISSFAQVITEATFFAMLKKEIIVYMSDRATFQGTLIRNKTESIIVKSKEGQKEIFKNDITKIYLVDEDGVIKEKYTNEAEVPSKPQTKENMDKYNSMVDEYYNLSMTGNNMADIGKSVFVPGIILDIIGGVSLFIAIVADDTGSISKDDEWDVLRSNGFICLGSGILLTAAGTSLRLIGQGRQVEAKFLKAKILDFNASLSPSLNLRNNSIGLALTIGL